MTYQERKEAKAERFRELAAKFKKESSQLFVASNKIADHIPFGQPILVGHHSEKRHRRDVDRIHSYMQKSVDADKKADYYEQRAATIENSNVISSDDPEALDKLKEKLAKLEETQAYMKLTNKAYSAYQKNKETGLNKFPELTEKQIKIIVNYVPEYSFLKHPFPAYMLSNNNGNIARIRERIKTLEERQSKETTEVVIGDVKMVENIEANRLQLFFPSKPSEETRKKLKSYGFRWSPTQGAWQAFLSNRSKNMALLILNPEAIQY